MANIDDFKAKLTGGGARANYFKVICNFPAGINVNGANEIGSFLIKNASLPASTIGMFEIPFRGRKLKLAGDRTFDQYSITVLNDVGFTIRNAFERWMNSISQHVNNVGLDNANDYQSDIIVQQLNRNEDILKQYTLRGAFPINISAIELSAEAADTIEEFTVDLQYQYWTSDTTT